MVLLNSSSEINVIISVYIAKLDLISQTTTIGAQKINSMALKTYGVIITEFLVYNKLGRAWFFEKTFC